MSRRPQDAREREISLFTPEDGLPLRECVQSLGRHWKGIADEVEFSSPRTTLEIRVRVRASDQESSDDDEDPPRYAPAQPGFLALSYPEPRVDRDEANGSEIPWCRLWNRQKPPPNSLVPFRHGRKALRCWEQFEMR
jgi:hypothetical protein